MPTSWHLTSLTVLGGALHGKKLAIEDAVVEVLIGSDPDCHLHLDLATVSPIHARLWIEPDDVTVYGTRSGPGVFVNFDRVDGEGKVRPGDMLWLGPPQAAGSVMLQAHFEERDSLPPVLVAPLPDEGQAGEGEAAPVSLPPASLSLPEEAAPIPVATISPGEVVGPSSIADTMGPGPETPVRDEPIIPSVEAPPPLPPASPAAPEPAPVASPEPPDTSAASPGFEDFLVMESPPAAGPPPPAGEEFLVSGFEAEWPEAPKAARVETPPPATSGDDVFFIDDAAPAPPGPVPAGADSFFVDEGVLAPPAEPAPSPALAAPPASPAPAGVSDLESLSFAAAFLAEAPPEAPPPLPPKTPPAAKPPAATPSKPVAVPPSAKPTASAPPSPKAAGAGAPVAPPLPAKAGPGVSQSVPRASMPPRSPSSTAAVRPLPRPDVSQSVARRDRPPAARGERTQPARPRRPAARPIGRYVVMGALSLAALLGGALLVSSLVRGVRLEAVEPRRVRIGETIALTGRGFGTAPGGTVVLFGDKEAAAATATATRLEVVVPEVAVPAGSEAPVPVRVRVGRAESLPVEISVFSGPVLHGISPDVAMPGDEVVLAGSGWGLGPGVRFGGLAADVLEVRETSMRVKVPAIDGGVGTAAPVVVTSGTLESNPGPFYVGRIPLVLKAEPTTVSPGDVVTLDGRGFRRERTQNSVQVGGVRALVVSAFDTEIKFVVPRVPPGSRTLDVRVPSSVAPAEVPLVVTGLGDAVDFRFIAEPFDGAPGRDHAVLATPLGPAFVLASSGGRSSAERAIEAARRFNEAGSTLKAARDVTFELRDPDSRPTLGLSGRPEVVLEVTEEDAAAYAEDWTGLRGRGGTVSAGRLGRWWEAVARDLVLLLVRGERPHFAADLAPEGRAFVDLFQAGARGGGLSAPAAAKAPLRDALRLIALRVPPTVRGPAGAAPVSASATPSPAATTAGGAMPKLEGTWTGTESERGDQRYLTLTFRGTTGTIAYEGVMTVSAPLLSVDQPQRGTARFSVEVRGGLRYYNGRWDGQALTGKISGDPGGTQAIGTFELRPR